MMRPLLSLLILLALPGAVAAQGDPWQRQVHASLARSDLMMRKQGYTRTIGEYAGALITGESRWIVLQTPGVGSVAIVGICDEDCGALRLTLGTTGGYELVASDDGSTVPMLEAELRPGEEYRVRVGMDRCQVSPCRYGFALYRRRPE